MRVICRSNRLHSTKLIHLRQYSRMHPADYDAFVPVEQTGRRVAPALVSVVILIGCQQTQELLWSPPLSLWVLTVGVTSIGGKKKTPKTVQHQNGNQVHD